MASMAKSGGDNDGVVPLLKQKSADELRELLERMCKEVPEAARWLEKEAAAAPPSSASKPSTGYCPPGVQQDKPPAEPAAPPAPRPESSGLNPNVPTYRPLVKKEAEEGPSVKYSPPVKAEAADEPSVKYNPPAAAKSAAKEEEDDAPAASYNPLAAPKPQPEPETPKDSPPPAAAAAKPAAAAAKPAAAAAAPAAAQARPAPAPAPAPVPVAATKPTASSWGARPANIVPDQHPPAQNGQAPQQRPAQAAAPVPRPAPVQQTVDPFSFKNSMIFKANAKTWDECINRGLFGLPENQWKRVKDVQIGETACFLLDFVNNDLMGLFEPTSAPGMNIEPDAWKGAMRTRNGESPFPAQVRVKQVLKWRKVHISKFEHLLRFHNNNATFDLFLDQKTTQALMQILLSEN